MASAHQPIGCQDWKSFLINMQFSMGISKTPDASTIGKGFHLLADALNEYNTVWCR